MSIKKIKKLEAGDRSDIGLPHPRRRAAIEAIPMTGSMGP